MTNFPLNHNKNVLPPYNFLHISLADELNFYLLLKTMTIKSTQPGDIKNVAKVQDFYFLH